MQELIGQLEKTALETEFSGVISIYQDSAPIFDRACGYRDVKNKLPNTPSGGYVFLGVLIEKLTGSLYRDYIQEHVLQAANMDNSGFYALNDLPENAANGYLDDRQQAGHVVAPWLFYRKETVWLR